MTVHSRHADVEADQVEGLPVLQGLEPSRDARCAFRHHFTWSKAGQQMVQDEAIHRLVIDDEGAHGVSPGQALAEECTTITNASACCSALQFE